MSIWYSRRFFLFTCYFYKTPSPLIPLPLQKGKGEEILEEGHSPSSTPCYYNSYKGKREIFKEGAKPPL
jgi:hypothetical protein